MEETKEEIFKAIIIRKLLSEIDFLLKSKKEDLEHNGKDFENGYCGALADVINIIKERL